jgi:hypothetical protein
LLALPALIGTLRMVSPFFFTVILCFLALTVLITESPTVNLVLRSRVP